MILYHLLWHLLFGGCVRWARLIQVIAQISVSSFVPYGLLLTTGHRICLYLCQPRCMSIVSALPSSCTRLTDGTAGQMTPRKVANNLSLLSLPPSQCVCPILHNPYHLLHMYTDSNCTFIVSLFMLIQNTA